MQIKSYLYLLSLAVIFSFFVFYFYCKHLYKNNVKAYYRQLILYYHSWNIISNSYKLESKLSIENAMSPKIST